MADDQPWNIVKIPPIVQELVAGVQEPPSWYVVPEEDRTASGSEMPEPIPIVDLSRLSASDEIAKLQSALEYWGLFLAVGHGMEPSFLAEVMKVAREFYKLPPEEKQKYSNLVDGKEFRMEGYGNDCYDPCHWRHAQGFRSSTQHHWDTTRGESKGGRAEKKGKVATATS